MECEKKNENPNDEEQSPMEVDNPELEKPHSPRPQTNLIDIGFTSETDRNLLEVNVTVFTEAVSSATACQKSIFDPDEKFQNYNREDSSTICENTSANEAAHCESVRSAPVVDTIGESEPSETTSSTEVVNANADEISSPCNVSENEKSVTTNEVSLPTPDISSSLNVSTSNGNTTFYDEFDIVHVCEVETCYADSRLSSSSTSVLSQASPLSVKNESLNNIQLKDLLQKILQKSTNEMIEEVQIKIEIGDTAFLQSMAHEIESVVTRSIPVIEVDEESRKNDYQQTIETSAIKSSSVCKKLTYPTVKRTLTEKSLDIAKERPLISSLCVKPGSFEFSNSSSSCSCPCESCSINDKKHNDHCETDNVLEPEAPRTDAIREKKDYDVDFIIESQSKSPPLLSPLPMSPNSITQPVQSNNPIEVNSGKLENYEDDSSQSTTFSNQSAESDLVCDLGDHAYNISGKTEAELFSKFKLNMCSVVLTRLPIDYKTRSSAYKLRRKKHISYKSLIR